MSIHLSLNFKSKKNLSFNVSAFWSHFIISPCDIVCLSYFTEPEDMIFFYALLDLEIELMTVSLLDKLYLTLLSTKSLLSIVLNSFIKLQTPNS